MPASLEHWRSKQHEQDQKRQLAKHYDSAKREWITVDGEGWGRDDTGRQHYRFMIAANEMGFQMKCEPRERLSLTTTEALDWLASIPHNYRLYCHRKGIEYHQPLIGGFALGYDYSHILIDITQEQLENLLTHQDFESDPTDINDQYAVKLTAGNLRVYTRAIKPLYPYIQMASIYDTFKYYQAAFLKVMGAYATPEQWAIIEAGKERRSVDDEHDISAEMVYCLNECRVHSRAMNDLSRAIHEMELHPRGWYGPGSLAASAMRKHRTKKYWIADSELDPGLSIAAKHAYIGGRFETTGHGWVPKMYGHDIRSAYPDGMTRLPCLVHGEWKHLTKADAVKQMMYDPEWYMTQKTYDILCLGLVEWHCDNPPGGWGPYPTRSVGTQLKSISGIKSKLPAWPFHGINWLWNEEYKAGLSFTTSTDVKEAWIYERQCDCQPFDWIPEYYDLRYELKAAGNEIGEKVVKLILNSGYGKIAQTIGNPPVPSWIWAGLITQSARATLLRAIATNPEACFMVATDAVYSTEPLDLDFGPALGQWDGPDEYGRTLVIQAGFWRDYENGTSKTRGIAKKYLDGDKDHRPLWPVFESLWADILNQNLDIRNAVVPVRYSDHIGLQRARQYGIEYLGRWTDDAIQDIRFRVDKRPHLIGSPSTDGWWKSAPTRTDRVGEQLSMEVIVGEQYIAEERSAMDRYFVVEQPDAAEWGYSDD